MPIDYKKYKEFYDLEISDKLKKMLGNRCEFCGVKNYKEVWRNGKLVTIVLTVHHRDGNPKNNQRKNLLLLCQRCHMKYNYLLFKKGQKTVRDFFKKRKKEKFSWFASEWKERNKRKVIKFYMFLLIL